MNSLLIVNELITNAIIWQISSNYALLESDGMVYKYRRQRQIRQSVVNNIPV